MFIFDAVLSTKSFQGQHRWLKDSKSIILHTFAALIPFSIGEIAVFFSLMMSSRSFLHMFVVYIDNVETTEVITTSGLQKKKVYDGVFVTAVRKIENV